MVQAYEQQHEQGSGRDGDRPARLPYERPVIRRVGSVATLTGGGASPGVDGPHAAQATKKKV